MKECGYVMSGDVAVARIENGNVTPIIDNLMPTYLKRTKSFEGWLNERAIDSHRTNSRLLKKVLRLTTATDAEVVLKANAVTITDNYWFKADSAELCYDDVRFKENVFDRLALLGDPDSFNQKPQSTPELTNIGSYEKCWRIIDGEWWLYKQGTDEEIFSELFISILGTRFGFNMAYYEKDGKYIRSRDFTRSASVNLESMYSYVGDEEDYEKNFETLYEILPDAAKEYVEMIFLDTVCFNMDRHTRNYGVLREITTGKVIGMAPNYDNNIALISRGYPKNISRESDRLIELFTEFISGNEAAREFYDSIDKKVLCENVINETIAETGFDVDEKVISDFILNGADKIEMTLGEQFMGEDMGMQTDW